MIVIISVALPEVDRAMDLLGWIQELGGCSNHRLLIVFANPVRVDDAKSISAIAAPLFATVEAIRQNEKEEFPWPRNANAMFKCAYDFIRSKPDNDPFLWMECDMIPIREGWLDEIEREYISVGKPVMGARYDKPVPHINGGAVYPHKLHLLNPWMIDSKIRPFDLVKPEVILGRAHVTSLIVRSLEDPSKNLPYTFPTRESLSMIPSKCVLFHGNKDSTLIQRLRERKNGTCPKRITRPTRMIMTSSKRAPRLAFAGLIKFQSADAEKMLNSMDSLFNEFPDWHGFFCVHSQLSPDVAIVKKWLKSKGKEAVFISDPRILPAGRLRKMAALRNRYLEAIDNSGFDPDYVFALDMDIAGFADWSGLKGLLKNKEWSAAAVMGLRPRKELPHFHSSSEYVFRNETYCYYDLLALESMDGIRTLWYEGMPPSKWYWHGDAPIGTVFSNKFPVKWNGDKLVEVNNAFGPACLYRWEDVSGFRHNESIEEIEHAGYQRQIRSIGGKVFICPNIVALYSDPWNQVITEAQKPSVGMIARAMNHLLNKLTPK